MDKELKETMTEVINEMYEVNKKDKQEDIQEDIMELFSFYRYGITRNIKNV